MKNHNKAFGRALRALRLGKGFTQEAFAFAAGLDRTYISLLELGTSSPTLDTLYAVSGALGLTLDQLALHIESARKEDPQP